MNLSKSALFAGISESEYRAMLHCFETYERTYAAGETIGAFREKKRTVGILQSGKAAILRLNSNGGHTVLDHLEEGGLFGEVLAFFRGRTRGYFGRLHTALQRAFYRL